MQRWKLLWTVNQSRSSCTFSYLKIAMIYLKNRKRVEWKVSCEIMKSAFFLCKIYFKKSKTHFRFALRQAKKKRYFREFLNLCEFYVFFSLGMTFWCLTTILWVLIDRGPRFTACCCCLHIAKMQFYCCRFHSIKICSSVSFFHLWKITICRYVCSEQKIFIITRDVFLCICVFGFFFVLRPKSNWIYADK